LCNVHGELARRRLVVRPLRHNGAGMNALASGSRFCFSWGLPDVLLGVGLTEPRTCVETSRQVEEQALGIAQRLDDGALLALGEAFG
jgi:hypothetical protein